MAAAKTVKTLIGTDLLAHEKKGDHPVEPINVGTAVAAVLQLQHTVDEVITRLNDLITKHNTHTHVENTAGAYAQNASTAAVVVGFQGTAVGGGAGVASPNLFTTS